MAVEENVQSQSMAYGEQRQRYSETIAHEKTQESSQAGEEETVERPPHERTEELDIQGYVDRLRAETMADANENHQNGQASETSSVTATAEGSSLFGTAPKGGLREVPGEGHEKKYVADIHPVQRSDAPAQPDEQMAIDYRNAFSGVPQVKKQWQDKYFKILVCGESGLGKTTFIKNMFASFAQDPDLKVNDASDPTSQQVFVSTPDKLMTEIVVKDNANFVAFHYRIQDTPGHDLGQDASSIVTYVKNQYHAFLEREQDPSRPGSLSEIEDPRVDVALYFLSPHRVKKVDVEFVTELAAMVPVIPCLAKADSMTQEELKAYRKTVKEMFSSGKTKMYQFDEELLEEANIRRDVPPFAIVASRTADLSIGRFWPVRQYPWGVCEAMSSRHSDMAALKKLLFEVAFEELKTETNKRFYAFRQQQITKQQPKDIPPDQKEFMDKVAAMVDKHEKTKMSAISDFAAQASKYVLAGLAVYLGIAFTAGGAHRVRKDLEIVKDKTLEAAEVVAEKVTDAAGTVVEATGDAAGFLADKAGDAAGYVADKAGDAAEVVADKAGDVLDKAGEARDVAAHKARKVAGKAANKAGEVKDAAVDKVAGGTEGAARRLEKAAAEERRRRNKRGFFHWGKNDD